jgi:GTPase SAR1 family protein
MAYSPQPAKKGYFFEQGYADIKNVVKETFAQIKGSIDEQKDKMDMAEKFGKIFWGSVIVALWVFGGLISLIISGIHIVVNFLIMIFYYLLFLVVLLIDRTYLSIKKISISCRECKAKFMYPIYVCPNCGEKHDHLTASVYGAFKRTCNCGEKLPTSILNFKNKRSDLEAHCPHCASVGRETPLSDRQSRPVCIPVVGGPSVGKSAFITAYANLFIDSISVDKGVDIEFYDDSVGSDFTTKKGFYRAGQIIKTAVQTDLTRASSIAFSFFVKHQSMNPPRLVHIYDIAGESFIDGANEVQKQYDYCNGIILLIDPFSIPNVMARFGTKLNSTDLGGTSSASIDSMMENFILTLEHTTGLSKSKILNTPLAVVLNKTDEADLDLLIGDSAVARAMANNPEVFTDSFDTMDYLCREFLRKVDMNDVLAHIQQNFKRTRFFAVSAIGHTLNQGRYNPRNVAPVLDWIFKNSDKKLASLITSTEFSDKKLPIVSEIETISLEEEAIAAAAETEEELINV